MDFSSGMGAISDTLLSLLIGGDHLVADMPLYGCTSGFEHRYRGPQRHQVP